MKKLKKMKISLVFTFALFAFSSLNSNLIFAQLSDVPQKGFIIRDISSLGENYYVPRFSPLQQNGEKETAMANGEDNLAKFWADNYARPLGEARGKFTAHFGLSMTPGQNAKPMVSISGTNTLPNVIILDDSRNSLKKSEVPLGNNSQQSANVAGTGNF